jgi:large subunit ribosomal protein L25
MSDIAKFDAELRDRAGKGAARATRRAGRVPAVIYGNKEAPVMISVDPKALWRELDAPGFYIRQFDVAVDGKAHRVLARDVQFHPVNDRPLHVDFLRVTEKTRINVHIPVRFVEEEESPGLKRGGVLNVVRREVEVTCTVGNIPAEFVIDLTGMEIGDSAHISNIDLPEGVTPVISDRDFTIATVAAPTVVREEAAAEAAAALEAAEAAELLGEEGLEGVEGEAAEGAEGEGEGEGEGKTEGGDDKSKDKGSKDRGSGS